MAELALRVVEETSKTITLGWTPPPGVQWYTFYADGVRVANAPPADKAGVVKNTVKFAKGGATYQVLALGTDATGVWPQLTRPHELTPPKLDNPTTIQLTNGNCRLTLDRTKDYILEAAAPITVKGGVVVNGGRNIICRGLVVNLMDAADLNVDNTHALTLVNLTGTFHLEDAWLWGDGVGQAILFALQSATDKPIVQVQRCRIEADHPASDAIHSDGIQSYGGPYELHLHEVSIYSATGTPIQIQPHNLQTASPVGRWSFHRVNCVQTATSGAKYALWKNYDKPAAWPVEQSDVWVRNTGYLAWANSDGGKGIDGWNPGGVWNVSGEPWHIGLRPAGDFVPRRV